MVEFVLMLDGIFVYIIIGVILWNILDRMIERTMKRKGIWNDDAVKELELNYASNSYTKEECVKAYVKDVISWPYSISYAIIDYVKILKEINNTTGV